MCYIHTAEYYPVIKRNCILIQTTRVNFANIMLSKRSQTQRPRVVSTCIFHLYEMSQIGKSIETLSILVIARGWGRAGEYRSDFRGGSRRFFPR